MSGLGAQPMVGNMYRKGLGVEKNSQKAYEYLKKSSQQSCGEAQYERVNMYLSEGQEANDKTKKLMQEAY